MTAPVPSPDRLPSLTPLLGVADASAALAWYARVFGAEEIMRLTAPDGTVVHAEARIGDELLMLGEEDPARGSPGPASLGGTSVRVHLYLEDVDAVFHRALEEGAEEVFPLRDQLYGDRSGRVRDPFGHEWILARRRESLTPEEMQARMEAMFEEG